MTSIGVLPWPCGLGLNGAFSASVHSVIFVDGKEEEPCSRP